MAETLSHFCICLSTATQPNYTDCQKRYVELSKNPVSGQYIPWCKPDGGYYWRQCYGSYCFCVDQYGKEVKNTRVYSSNGTPKCSKDGKNFFPYFHFFIAACQFMCPHKLN